MHLLESAAAAATFPGNHFDPGALVSPHASMGEGNHFQPGVMICPGVEIGSGNRFQMGCSVGSPSRQRILSSVPLAGDPKVRIGDGNLFFEYATVHAPIGESTRIGSRVSVGAHTHIAHDVQLFDEVVIAPNCAIGGFSTLLHGANLGLGCSVNPRLVIGALTMSGAGATVISHVLPGSTVLGVPARYRGVNAVGLERAGWTAGEIAMIPRVLAGDESATVPRKYGALLTSFNRLVSETIPRRRIDFEPRGAEKLSIVRSAAL